MHDSPLLNFTARVLNLLHRAARTGNTNRDHEMMMMMRIQQQENMLYPSVFWLSIAPKKSDLFQTSVWDIWHQEYITPKSVQRLIQLCIGSWSSGIGSSDVMRTLHTSARPVSRQGTVVFDPRVPATPRVPLGCVRYYDAMIRLRSTKTLCRAGSGVAHSGGGGGGGGYVLLMAPYQYPN